MKLDEALAELEALGNEKTRAFNAKNGAGENQFGVKMGDIRILAKRIKTDPDLAAELWETGNVDARLLATLLMKPKQLSAQEVDRLVGSVTYAWLADWLMAYVVKLHPQKEELRRKWMADSDPIAARAGWSLTDERILKNPEGLDVSGLLGRIEREMGDAPDLPKWTMNFCLISIGIHFPEHRERAIAIGEKIGAYRDYPTSKGCTSPFAPICINEMVRRREG